MFNTFSTPVQARVLTLDAIRLTTGLDWHPVDLEDPKIPADPGVYAWVGPMEPHPLWYHGSGRGQGGLHSRLSAQLRWRQHQASRLEADTSLLSEQNAYDRAREVPAVQQAVTNSLHYAVAGSARWSVERNDIGPPEGPVEWEAFISAVSLLVTGHRSLIGGGSWESKAGTVDQLMTNLAWDRLVDLHDGRWA